MDEQNKVFLDDINMFQSVVIHSMEPIVAIDNAYNIILLNHAMKINSKLFFGKELHEGINLKDILSDNPSLLDAWTTVINTGQPSTRKFCQGELSEVSCYPLTSTDHIQYGAYGFLRRDMFSDDSENDGDNCQHGFQAIADSLPHCVYLTKPNGHVYYCNQWCCRYTGIQEHETFGTRWSSVVHPDDAVRATQLWNEAVNNGEKFQIRYRLKRSDGTYRWNLGKAEPIKNVEGQIIRWIGTCTDIEDFVQTECKLLNLTEQLELLMSAAHFGVWSWDFPDDKLVADDNTLQLLNINPENFQGAAGDALSRFHPEDLPRVLASIQRAKEAHTFYDEEVRIKDSDKTVEARGKVFWNEKGEAVRMVGICWDITQRKTLEKERMKALEFAEEQARQRTQQAADHQKRIEEFVDTICHEIRNPLNGITGIASLMRGLLEPLLSGKLELKQAEEAIQQLVDCVISLELCAEQQQVIVDDVLDLSKVEHNKLELHPTLFNPLQLLETTRGIFIGALKQKNLQFEVNCSDGVDNSFQADSQRLSQILINLISNSIKFTEMGKISINITKEDLPTDSNCLLHFVVQDTGIGMTSEEKDRLFKKYAQANASITPRYGGSGLGLVISKKLVKRMGGVLHVDSEKGHGTRFEFTIQCKEVSNQEPVNQACVQKYDTHCCPNLSSIQVLIVEDNVINQKIITSYLKQTNCTCHIANNGVEALQQCSQTKFDIIFMDLEMPVMGGLEATRNIRQQYSPNQQTPIIGLSGNARKEHRDEAIQSGMNEYLTKPYHRTDIYEKIMQFGGTTESMVCTKRKRIN